MDEFKEEVLKFVQRFENITSIEIKILSKIIETNDIESKIINSENFKNDNLKQMEKNSFYAMLKQYKEFLTDILELIEE